MSVNAFLLNVGCFLAEGFLDQRRCHNLIDEILRSDSSPAKTVGKDDAVSVDENYRRTRSAKVSRATRLSIYQDLYCLKSRFEDHFGVELEGCDVPQFLRYREGDFFRLHKDVSDDDVVATRNSNRKISVVIFLNDQRELQEEHSYCGGSLNLYGLINQPGWDDKGVSLHGKEGMLIAFQSNILHEVVPVTYGERFTVVCWFN